MIWESSTRDQWRGERVSRSTVTCAAGTEPHPYSQPHLDTQVKLHHRFAAQGHISGQLSAHRLPLLTTSTD